MEIEVEKEWVLKESKTKVDINVDMKGLAKYATKQ